jgi:hypothetical protein
MQEFRIWEPSTVATTSMSYILSSTEQLSLKRSLKAPFLFAKKSSQIMALVSICLLKS